MSKKSIQDKFSIEMDAYFNGIEETNRSKSEEYNELLELGKTLAHKDFSESSNKEAVFHKALNNINEHKGENIMKKSNRIKRPAIAVATFAFVCIALMQTSFAQDFAERIIKTINLGHISAVQVEEPQIEDFTVPDELKGKIFDKEGKPVEDFSQVSDGKIYTADGEEIVAFVDGEIVTASDEEGEYKIVKDPTELNNYTCFNVILPSYLPEGYKFDRAEFIKHDDGTVSDKYINLYFTNKETGKYIFMQQRFACEETKSVSSTDGKIEKIKVNGVDAILSDNRYIDWEANNVIYALSGRGEITKEELIKIAKSIK